MNNRNNITRVSFIWVLVKHIYHGTDLMYDIKIQPFSCHLINIPVTSTLSET